LSEKIKLKISNCTIQNTQRKSSSAGSTVSSSPTLQICCLLSGSQDRDWQEQLREILPADRYSVTIITSLEALSELWQREGNSQDCLVVCDDRDEVRHRIANLGLLLPMVIVANKKYESAQEHDAPDPHIMLTAVLGISCDRLTDLPDVIDQAIATFLKLSPPQQWQPHLDIPESKAFLSLTVQQRRLSEKLKERLGYLGVYYKRDPKQFFRRLPSDDKELLINRLKDVYRTVVLEYFKDGNSNLNQQIDEFVNLAFFSDISITQVLEIHMSLIDEFSQKLKLEGRSDEVLLDYRITLIDVIAHLCELYRRSIPREA
jgi:circadian clock protein KaiA